MKILIAIRGVKDDAPFVLGDFLREQGHTVHTVDFPLILPRRVVSHYDVAIATDISTALALRKPRKGGTIDRLIFWRMQPNNLIKIGKHSLDMIDNYMLAQAVRVDEVWSAAPLNAPNLAQALGASGAMLRHVPYMLAPFNNLPQERRSLGVWIGDSRADVEAHDLAQATITSVGLDFQPLTFDNIGPLAYASLCVVVDYEREKDYPEAKVAASWAVPLLTMQRGALESDVEGYNAGLTAPKNVIKMKAVAEAILENVDGYGEGAFELAASYVISEKWVRVDGGTQTAISPEPVGAVKATN
tara:strand:- start:2432 stop:3334 length:903 start_codon:yes stop_codon:yes gene_type:complete